MPPIAVRFRFPVKPLSAEAICIPVSVTHRTTGTLHMGGNSDDFAAKIGESAGVSIPSANLYVLNFESGYPTIGGARGSYH